MPYREAARPGFPESTWRRRTRESIARCELYSVSRDAHHQVHFSFIDDIGRHEVDNIADGAQQHPLLQRVPVDALPPPLSPGIGLAAALVPDEFDRDNHSALPDLAHVRVIFKFACAAAEIGGLRSIALDRMVGGKYVERRQC